MILNATEAVYQWLLFLRGKNGGIVRNRGFSLKKKQCTFLIVVGRVVSFFLFLSLLSRERKSKRHLSTSSSSS